MDIIRELASQLNIKTSQVEKTVELIDEGNTIPFISRYRKEVTGNLTDEELRNLDGELKRLRALQQRKEEVIRLVKEQEQWTEEFQKAIEEATKLQEVEDLYLPYRPKRRTRATMAKEKGAEPLAQLLLALAPMEQLEEEANRIIDPENDINSTTDSFQLAMDIIAEIMSEDIDVRNIVRNDGWKGDLIATGKEEEDPDGVYKIYYDFSGKVKDLKSYQILALFRGEKENVLKLSFQLKDDYNIFKITRKFCKENNYEALEYIEKAAKDSYKRLILPSIETEIRNELKERADDQSIEVFQQNLKPYIMQPPLRDSRIIGLDPGFRTGCKVAVISAYGDYLDHDQIFPTEPKNDVEGSIATLKKLIEKYDVDLIAIGNGTASRETEKVVVQLIKEMDDRKLYYTIVNEAGASIYSASDLAREEFPDLDVTIRGAISIARRIQDPMAELVKIEPQHIGVGQYQHDVNQKKLGESLENVVEDCVNGVGVDINTASTALLSYVAGITKTTAKNILSYRQEEGPFVNRKQILKVKGIGPKSFEQCAGFLRIPEGENVLDRTAVHPESYEIASLLLEEDLDKIQLDEFSKKHEIGIPTLKDIINELKKPGRDPREEMPQPILKSDVLSMDDLEEGMELKGTVRNVVDFGAFIDIGLEKDALCHISHLSNKFIKHPSEVVEVSDIVDVRVLSIDRERGRINLTMKN
ncbi:MAG: Tex family protein [Tissierellia bacterium]|nr:Tex family protein [Tissierellia bacterium]